MSFEMNKILGAVLGTLLFVMGLGIVAEGLFTPSKPAIPGYDLPAGEKTAEAGAAEKVAAVPFPVLLAKADAKRGAKDIGACKACHNFEKGAGAKIGPPLWDVVDRDIASYPGFNYSDALKKVKAEKGKWTFEHLNHFITNPKQYAPGTHMNFAGIQNDEKRADVIAFLASNNDNPVPLPKADAAPAAKPDAAKPAAPAAAPAPAPAAAPAK